MKIEFIENHPVGIEKGRVAEMLEADAQRMINQGYAIPLTEKKKGKKGKKKDKK
jgi:hypothetical protein